MQSPQSESVDVAIIGGGIIGVSTAWFLVRRGLSVALYEKGRIGGEQSGRNWGFVRQQGRAPTEIPLSMESLRNWRQIETEIGEPVGFRQAGIIYTGQSEEDLASFEQFVEHARPYQLDSHVLSRSELDDLVPGLGGNWIGGLHTPSDGRAEPRLAAPAIARAAARSGAKIVTGCAVRGLDIEAGRIAGVITESGRTKAGSVVLAGGIWSSLLCGNHDISLPQLRVQNNVFRTGKAPEVFAGAIWAQDVAIRRRMDGGYTVAHGGESDFHIGPDALRHFFKFQPAYKQDRDMIRLRFGAMSLKDAITRRRWTLDDTTPFEATRVMNPKPYRETILRTYNNLCRRFPSLGDVGIEATWAGIIDVTPDAIPVISPVDELPGFFISTGFSGHGFGIGLGAGRLTSELVMNAPTCVDPVPFRLRRFADGAPNPYGGSA